MELCNLFTTDYVHEKSHEYCKVVVENARLFEVIVQIVDAVDKYGRTKCSVYEDM